MGEESRALPEDNDDTSRELEGNAVIPERTMEEQKKRKKQHPRKRERLSEGSVTGDAQGGLSTFSNLIF